MADLDHVLQGPIRIQRVESLHEDYAVANLHDSVLASQRPQRTGNAAFALITASRYYTGFRNVAHNIASIVSVPWSSANNAANSTNVKFAARGRTTRLGELRSYVIGARNATPSGICVRISNKFT